MADRLKSVNKGQGIIHSAWWINEECGDLRAEMRLTFIPCSFPVSPTFSTLSSLESVTAVFPLSALSRDRWLYLVLL